ncbi:MAG: hypothetical protein ABUL73_00480 [Alphaproteobacteria bacterium]
MQWIFALAAVVLALFAIDQIALWAERRGWIYWRKTKGRRGGVGDVFLGVEAGLNPRADYVVQAKQAKKREDRGAGDPPELNS